MQILRLVAIAGSIAVFGASCLTGGYDAQRTNRQREVARFPGKDELATHGAAAACKVKLQPVWISRIKVTPAAPMILNGFAFGTGEYGGGRKMTASQRALHSPAIAWRKRLKGDLS